MAPVRFSAVLLSLAISVPSAPSFGASPVNENDWPQLAHDSARTAHASQGVPAPYRARWIWFGPALTLRNRAANPAWPDDLAVGTKVGFDYPTPEKVSFTLAGRAQPVVAKGRVFFGDMDGKIYAVNADDGQTVWVGENPGGTCAALAVVGDVVVAGSIFGGLTGFDVGDGRARWHFATPKAITSAPLALGEKVFIGCHDGRLYAVTAVSGKLLWTSENLGASIVGDIGGETGAIYAGAENMFFHKIDSSTGKVVAKTRLNGQSFRLLYPVIHNGLIFVQTVQPICVGSEYVMEDVMRDSPNIATEQTNILHWLSGDTNNGKWRDASSAWKHLFALRTSDLSEAFTIPNGPADGCGMPAPPPVIDGVGRPLAWFKTAHPTLTAKGSFGTRYSMDISAIDTTTGFRVPIDNGRLGGTTGESDNLFALSSGGSLLYLRQRFRGTKVIDLQQSSSHLIQAAIRTRDGGTWLADVVYRDRGGLPRSSQPALGGREAVVIAGDKLFFAEEYGVTCVEHRNP
jgi:hypothetical protein